MISATFFPDLWSLFFTRRVRGALFRLPVYYAFIFYSLIIALNCSNAWCAQAEAPASSEPTVPMHWSADRSKLNRKTNWVELRGNAVVNRDLETLRAEEVDLDLTTHDAIARGRVIYQYNDVLIECDRLVMNMVTKTGTLFNGRVTRGQLSLQGTDFDVLSSEHLIVKNYRYTTCIDCPNAWSIAGSELDLTFEGYAFIKDFVFRVKDASVIWSPYMIMPIKTKRQTGFLFPRFGLNEVHGSFFVQPFFWAINDWSDMTIGVGRYWRRGTRVEWEGRYMLTPRSQGTANLFWTKDPKLGPKVPVRAAGSVRLTQEMPLGFESKLRWYEISDSGYPIEFAEDMPGRFEPALTSDLFFSRNDPKISTTLSLRRIRNLLYFEDNSTTFADGFDPNTVQELPRIVVNTNNQFVFNTGIAAGMEARFNRFTRDAGPTDILLVNSVPTVVTREANRVTLIPSLYTTLNPVPWLSLVPSLQYRSFIYNFGGVYDDLARGYLLAQTEASIQYEKTFAEDEKGRRFKHSIRPMVTYSVIPTVQQSSDHPFIRSTQNTARNGSYFDNWDIVPLGTSQNLDTYFVPLGHSLTYGFVTQLFRKVREIAPPGQLLSAKPDADTAQLSAPAWRLAEFSLSQTFDIREAQQRGIPLSPLFANLLIEESNLSWNTDYTYFYALERYKEAQLKSFSSPHRITTGLKWTFASASANPMQVYERSVAATYSFSKLSSKVSALGAVIVFSLNDYLMPSASYTFDLTSDDQKLLESKYGLIYQSPSRCWRFDASLTRSIDRGVGFAFSFGLNLSGNGMTSQDDSLPKI